MARLSAYSKGSVVTYFENKQNLNNSGDIGGVERDIPYSSTLLEQPLGLILRPPLCRKIKGIEVPQTNEFTA